MYKVDDTVNFSKQIQDETKKLQDKGNDIDKRYRDSIEDNK